MAMCAPTYASRIQQYSLEFGQQRESQQISPFVIPFDISNYIILILYLTLKHRLPYPARSQVFLAIVILSIRSLQTSRTLGLAYGVLVGVSSSICVVLSASLLFLHQPAVDFKRMIAFNGNTYRDGRSKCVQEQWEGMPTSASERFFWILDLLGSLRALHWSHGQRQNHASAATSEKHAHQIPSLRRNIYKILLIYLSVDVLKEIIAIDPYFWGYTEHDPPNYIKIIFPFPALVQAYRMLVGFATFYIALDFDYTVSVLLFVNILGPSIVGTWGHAWAYRPLFGKIESIAARGLQGWWGAWWHQCFRALLTSPTHAIINQLRIQKRGVIARILALVIPFLISGAIHACGSYTLWGETKPINAFLFFVLQPVGIALQIISRWSLGRLGLIANNNIARSVREAVNVAFTVFWLLWTFPLLADDFAKGGLWLVEPFPISVLQSLGLGSQARATVLGFDYGSRFQMGFRWWQMGLAV